MARYKTHDARQVKLIPVSFADQILPGTFAYALNEIVDHLQQTDLIVEPAFGNRKNKGMDRFALRGKNKVNTQWQLFSLVHNIEKIASVAAA